MIMSILLNMTINEAQVEYIKGALLEISMLRKLNYAI